MTTLTIIKPINWKGVMVIRVHSKKKLKELSQTFKNQLKRNNIQLSIERKGKVQKVV